MQEREVEGWDLRDEVRDAGGGPPGVGDVGCDPGFEAGVRGKRGEEGQNDAFEAVGVEELEERGEG